MQKQKPLHLSSVNINRLHCILNNIYIFNYFIQEGCIKLIKSDSKDI